MSIESLYADGIEAGIRRQIANPTPEPAASFSLRSFLTSGVKAVPVAGLQVGGSLLDILGPAATESARHPLPAVMGDQPQDRLMADRASKFVAEGGDVMRAKASEFTPDPATASTADQVLFGLVRVGTKVAAALSVANLPVAAGLLAAEGTNTATRELMTKGIDPATALKVGAVEGLGQASAVIPLVGPTVKTTFGLMAASGPAAYMAQEAIARKILEKAGYNDEASRHDPVDPLGLTIATALPAIFGGAHIYGLTRATKPPPTLADVVQHLESGGKRYGKDGALLTSPKGAQGEMQVMPGTATDPGFGVVPARNNSPDELARVGRDYLDAMHHRYGEPDLALAAYNAGPGAVDKALNKYGANWREHMPAETRAYVAHGMNKLRQDVAEHGATDPVAIDAARVRVTQDALHRNLPDVPEAHAEVMRAADELAAGRMPDVRPVPTTSLPEFRNWFEGSRVVDSVGEPLIMYHGTRGDVNAFDPSMIKSRFPNSEGIYLISRPDSASVYADSVTNAADGFNPASKFVKPVADGANVVPVYVNLRNPKVIETKGLLESVVDGDNGALVRQAKAEGYDGVIVKRVNGDEFDGTLAVAFKPEQIKSATGNSGKFDPTSASLTDPLRPGERNPRSEGTNALPDPVKPVVEPAQVKARAADVQAAIDMRKRQSVLQSLLECIG
jgi:hypothetical protein